MTDDQFWDLIAASRDQFDPHRRDGNMDRQSARMQQLLEALDAAAVAEFLRLFNRHYRDAYRWDLWGAAFIIASGCSDDGFMDFRNWLISMGRDVYAAALADPESLAAAARAPGVEDIFFEGFGSIAYMVLEDRGQEPDDDEPGDADEPAGQRWTEDDLQQRFPKLWEAFGTT